MARTSQRAVPKFRTSGFGPSAVHVETTSMMRTGSSLVRCAPCYLPVSFCQLRSSLFDTLVRGNADSTSYGGPAWALTVQGRKGLSSLFTKPVSLCSIRDCTVCVLVPEYVAVHKDCFCIYKRELAAEDPKEMLHRLWRAGARRRPWRSSHVIRLLPEDIRKADAAWLVAFRRTALMVGLPQLLTLPLELTFLIYERSAGTLFWRTARVLRLCYRLLQWPLRPSSSPIAHYLPLSAVENWRRGGALELLRGRTLEEVSSTSLSEIPSGLWRTGCIRVAVDHYGIAQIQHLQKYPKSDTRETIQRDIQGPGPAAHGQQVYFVEHVGSLGNVNLEFFPCDGAVDLTPGSCSGRLRFFLDDHSSKLRLWDLAAPPVLQACTVINLQVFSMLPFSRTLPLASVPVIASQLHTVKLHGNYRRGGCSGLTFFFCHKQVYYIYAHRYPGDDALYAAKWFRPPLVDNATWIYMPISPNDRVEYMAAQYTHQRYAGGRNILVKMKLAGHITIGQVSQRVVLKKHVLPLGPGGDMTLIFGEPEDLIDNIGCIGTYSVIPASYRRLPPPPPVPSHHAAQVTPLDIREPGPVPSTPETPTVPSSVTSPPTIGLRRFFLSREFLLRMAKVHLRAAEATPVSPTRQYLSWAPLANVCGVRVFRQPETHYFWGMILYYSNGAQRAIGECRVNIDGRWGAEEEMVHNPTRVCFQAMTAHRGSANWIRDEYIDAGIEAGGKHSHEAIRYTAAGEASTENDSGSEPEDLGNGPRSDLAGHRPQPVAWKIRRSRWICCKLSDGGALAAAFSRRATSISFFPYDGDNTDTDEG